MCEGRAQKDFQRGKSYALHLLSYSDKTTAEIQKKLTKKDYPQLVVERVVQYLKKSGFLDDEEFTKKFTASKVKKGFSKKKIRYLLVKKGVGKSTVDKILNEVFSQIDEGKMARELLLRKKYLPIDKEASTEEKIKHISRIGRFLLRYGFSSATIKELVEQEKEKHLDFYR